MPTETTYDRTIDRYKTDLAFDEDGHHREGSVVKDNNNWTGRMCVCGWITRVGTPHGEYANLWERRKCTKAAPDPLEEARREATLSVTARTWRDELADMMSDWDHEPDHSTLEDHGSEGVTLRCSECKERYGWNGEDGDWGLLTDYCTAATREFYVSLGWNARLYGGHYVEARSEEEAAKIAVKQFRDGDWDWDDIDHDPDSVEVNDVEES